MTQVRHKEIEQSLDLVIGRLRSRAWLSLLVAAVVTALMVSLILAGSPALLVVWNKQTPWATLSPFLTIFAIAYVLGAVFLLVIWLGRGKKGFSELLLLAALVVAGGLLAVLLLRVYHVRSIDTLWALLTPIGFMIQFSAMRWVAPERHIGVPSEKTQRFAERLQLPILESPKDPKQVFTAIVFDPSEKYSEEWEFFLAKAAMMGMNLIDISRQYEKVLGKVHYADRVTLTAPSVELQPIYLAVKGIIEFVCILVTSPVWLFILLVAMIAIKLDDGGSLFFNQKRMGKFGREFTMFKLRSMTSDPSGSIRTTEENDHRVTNVGRFLRKYRIDELPQFFNILKGDMALIGPRAEWRHAENDFVDLSVYHLRHLVKPGITGWAQVLQGYTSTPDAARVKLEYDLYYVRNASFLLDLNIFTRTIVIILTGFGAR